MRLWSGASVAQAWRSFLGMFFTLITFTQYSMRSAYTLMLIWSLCHYDAHVATLMAV